MTPRPSTRSPPITDANKKIVSPIYVKTDPSAPFPADPFSYVLGSNGLFVCRNNQFMTSSVPAPNWPCELAPQRTFLKVRYPKVPRRLLEVVVGFFAVVYKVHRAEAAALLLWDQLKQRVRVLVPDQTSTVSRGWSGKTYPVGVHYEVPAALPAGCILIGDLHSHCDDPAYASYTDKCDETFRSGLHIVVGRIKDEPPEFHIEAVVDGTRFSVAEDLVLEGYRRRRMGTPPEWMDRVEIEAWGSRKRARSYQGGGSSAAGGTVNTYGDGPKPSDDGRGGRFDADADDGGRQDDTEDNGGGRPDGQNGGQIVVYHDPDAGTDQEKDDEPGPPAR